MNLGRSGLGDKMFENMPLSAISSSPPESLSNERIREWILDNDRRPSMDHPNKARIISMPSTLSASSSKFGGEGMIKAQRGLLVRASSEDSCLSGSGEDLSGE
jgi:hypothetical protein